MMSSEAMVSFLRKVAPGVEQSLQQNETVDIFQASAYQYPYISRVREISCWYRCDVFLSPVHTGGTEGFLNSNCTVLSRVQVAQLGWHCTFTYKRY